MDDDVVLGLLEEMDSKIDELKSDNKSMRKEIDDLKSNPAQSGESPPVGCTSNADEKWRKVTNVFFDEQEKALKDHKEAVTSDINSIQAQVSRLEDNIVDMRKKVE